MFSVCFLFVSVYVLCHYFDTRADFVTGHFSVKNYNLSDHLFTAATLLVVAHIYFFSVAQQPNSGLGPPIVEVSRSHTIRHTHARARIHTHIRQVFSEQVISPSQRLLPTQHTINTRDEHPYP
jgi:hypothetical protein